MAIVFGDQTLEQVEQRKKIDLLSLSCLWLSACLSPSHFLRASLLNEAQNLAFINLRAPLFLASPQPAPLGSFNSVINALGMAGLWKKALSVMEDMVLDGLAPNSVTYASAINACGNSRQLGRALALLREARLAGVEVLAYVCWDLC